MTSSTRVSFTLGGFGTLALYLEITRLVQLFHLASKRANFAGRSVMRNIWLSSEFDLDQFKDSFEPSVLSCGSDVDL